MPSRNSCCSPRRHHAPVPRKHSALWSSGAGTALVVSPRGRKAMSHATATVEAPVEAPVEAVAPRRTPLDPRVISPSQMLIEPAAHAGRTGATLAVSLCLHLVLLVGVVLVPLLSSETLPNPDALKAFFVRPLEIAPPPPPPPPPPSAAASGRARSPRRSWPAAAGVRGADRGPERGAARGRPRSRRGRRRDRRRRGRSPRRRRGRCRGRPAHGAAATARGRGAGRRQDRPAARHPEGRADVPGPRHRRAPELPSWSWKPRWTPAAS